MMVQAQEDMGEAPMVDETENVESVPTHSNDPLLSGEDSLKLNELIELCTNLQKKVLDFETTKTIQALEIDSLKRRVKKLEKKQSLGDLEDASKQGRKILDIDADEDITLDSTHVDTNPNMFGVHDLHGDEVFVEIEEPVVNASMTTTTTATTTVADEVKGQGSKDKGKEKIIEPEKPLKKKDQVLFDEQEAIRLQAEFDEEARVAREKEEANAVLVAQWNDIQDKVETDYELAQRLQQEEQEELTIKEKSKLFQQLLKKRRKFFAAKRARKGGSSFQLGETELVEGTKREESSKRDETIGQESSSKRAIISDEEGVAIDAIHLSTKSSSIVDHKIIKEGKIRKFKEHPPGVYEAFMKKLDDFEDKYQVYERIVRIKRLHDDLRVIAAQLMLLVQS
ncbi:hypothetical protein Tco_1109878 [Tanacetum coccineum]|uniref:Uncharacterized protein n=1 Tax=Tanacetum coccineum TaxID=301880 RepID=A0ABQ5IIK9_9ASTR